MSCLWERASKNSRKNTKNSLGFLKSKFLWKVFTFCKTSCAGLRFIWRGLLSLWYFSFTDLSRKDWGILLLAVPAFPCSLALWMFKGDEEGKNIKSKLSSWSQGGKFFNSKNEKGLKKTPEQPLWTALSSFRFVSTGREKQLQIFNVQKL